MGRRGIARIFFFLLFFLVLVSSSYADRTIRVGPEEDIKKIEDALNEAVSGDTVFVLKGEYCESIYLPPGITLKGESYYSVILKGRVISLNPEAEAKTASIETLTILYPTAETITYTNPHYSDFPLLADAGITAVDANISVRNCKIMPDLDSMNEGRAKPLAHYGKAIQVWNMYATPNIVPQIENNLIKDTECGIYYFSQASGGAINGEIKNNTFYHNKIGIALRMHKENPIIHNNIISKSENAIYFIYNSLLQERLQNITYNSFGGDSFDTFGNLVDIRCEQNKYELQVMLQCAPPTPPPTPRSSGGCSYWNNNIDGDPLFVDAENGNFSLQPDSPCKGKADDGGDLGARMDFEQHLSISLSPTTWLLNNMTISSSKITASSEKIIVLNDGNVKEDFSLRVSDITGGWSAADTVDGTDLNQYVLSGIFTASEVVFIPAINGSNFNELGGEDLILEGAPQPSSDIKFATSRSSKNGVGVMPGERRALWLKFDAPKADNTETQHNIRVIINAELSK